MKGLIFLDNREEYSANTRSLVLLRGKGGGGTGELSDF